MTNNKKVLVVLGGLVGVGTAIFFIFRKDPGKLGQFIRSITGENLVGASSKDKVPTKDTKVGSGSTVVNPPSKTQNSALTTSCSGYKAESWPLSICMKGQTVKSAQQAINYVYNTELKEDGYFGAQTQEAVVKILGRVDGKITENDFNSLTNSQKASQMVSGDASSGGSLGGDIPDAYWNPFSTLI
jgi:hypothetical protein